MGRRKRGRPRLPATSLLPASAPAFHFFRRPALQPYAATQTTLRRRPRIMDARVFSRPPLYCRNPLPLPILFNPRGTCTRETRGRFPNPCSAQVSWADEPPPAHLSCSGISPRSPLSNTTARSPALQPRRHGLWSPPTPPRGSIAMGSGVPLRQPSYFRNVLPLPLA